jgi:transposase
LSSMLAQGESVEAHALRERGWSISAIARHLGRNRETVRAYLNGERVPGVRAAAGPDAFGPYAGYCGQRFDDDPHLFATTLFDEVRELGYAGGYSSFTRALRVRGLRPRCERCAAAGTPAEFAVIDHPAGEETQWDWVELPDPPTWWG